jgi:hypothetical protein
MPRKYSAPTEPGWYWARKFEHTDVAHVVHVVWSNRVLVVESRNSDGLAGLRVEDFGCACWGPKVKEPRF